MKSKKSNSNQVFRGTDYDRFSIGGGAIKPVSAPSSFDKKAGNKKQPKK